MKKDEYFYNRSIRLKMRETFKLLNSQETPKLFNKKVVMLGNNSIREYDYQFPVARGYTKKNKSLASKKTEDYFRLSSSISRAIDRFYMTVESNRNPFTRFLTLTFADNITDKKVAYHYFTLFLKRIERRIGQRLQFVCVREYQKRGAIHYHLVVFNKLFISPKTFAECWRYGFVKAVKMFDNKNNGISKYITKYLTKTLNENKEDYAKGEKLYRVSFGLIKPINHYYMLTDECKYWSFFELPFMDFDIITIKKWTSDFCGIVSYKQSLVLNL